MAIIGGAFGVAIRHAYAQEAEKALRAELADETERANSAETTLKMERLGLTYQSDLDDLQRRMHLHATHLDVVESRIDQQGSAMKALIAEQYKDFAMLVTAKLKPLPRKRRK